MPSSPRATTLAVEGSVDGGTSFASRSWASSAPVYPLLVTSRASSQVFAAKGRHRFAGGRSESSSITIGCLSFPELLGGGGETCSMVFSPEDFTGEAAGAATVVIAVDRGTSIGILVGAGGGLDDPPALDFS